MPFKRPSIDENESESYLTKEEFEKLTLEEQFSAVFSGLKEDNWKDFLRRNDIALYEALYCLRLKNISGYMEACHFCNDKRCEGCPVPFDKNTTLGDLMRNLGITTNLSYFTEGYKRGKNDVIFEIVWSNSTGKAIDRSYFDSFQTAVSFPNQKGKEEETKE